MSFKLTFPRSKIILAILLLLIGATVYFVDVSAATEESGSFVQWLSGHWAFVLLLLSEILALMSERFSGILKVCLLLIESVASQVKNDSR